MVCQAQTRYGKQGLVIEMPIAGERFTDTLSPNVDQPPLPFISFCVLIRTVSSSAASCNWVRPDPSLDFLEPFHSDLRPAREVLLRRVEDGRASQGSLLTTRGISACARRP